MLKALAEDLARYNAERSDLVSRANGKYVLIRGGAIVSIFESETTALASGYETFGDTPFLVRRIAPTDDVINFSSMNVSL